MTTSMSHVTVLKIFETCKSGRASLSSTAAGAPFASRLTELFVSHAYGYTYTVSELFLSIVSQKLPSWREVSLFS